MKYFGKIEHEKDLVTKLYADHKLDYRGVYEMTEGMIGLDGLCATEKVYKGYVYKLTGVSTYHKSILYKNGEWIIVTEDCEIGGSPDVVKFISTSGQPIVDVDSKSDLSPYAISRVVYGYDPDMFPLFYVTDASGNLSIQICTNHQLGLIDWLDTPDDDDYKNVVDVLNGKVTMLTQEEYDELTEEQRGGSRLYVIPEDE